MGTVRLMLVDDHPLYREGLRSVILGVPGYLVAAEASTVEEALDKIKLTRPDLVLTDLHLGPSTGIELIRRLAQQDPELPVIVISIASGRSEVLEAIQAGARGYLTKFAERTELLGAISEVLQGRSYLHPSVANVVFDRVRRPLNPSDEDKLLTAREQELLKILGTGASPREAADQLVLAISTVKTHIRSLFRKLEVTNRTQLVLKAQEKGLLQPGG